MTPKTSQAQRAEVHKTIWRIANDLRGSVDGWDFKSYVLGMLFYRYISENLTAYINKGERAAGNAGFDYTSLADEQAEFGRDETVDEKGFYILPSELFANVRGGLRTTRTSTRLCSGCSATSRPPRWARTARTTSRACSTTSTSTAASSARPSPSATRSSSNCWTRSETCR